MGMDSGVRRNDGVGWVIIARNDGVGWVGIIGRNDGVGWVIIARTAGALEMDCGLGRNDWGIAD